MTNPTPQVVQLKIAELLGWTDLKRSPMDNRLWGLPPQDTVAELDLGKYMLVPNWPGDRNASIGLPVKNEGDYNRATDIVREKHYPDLEGDRLPADLESLAWILYKGYRWRECECCFGDGQAGDEICEPCSGNGGEFGKV